jgi:O-antigen/teichoic acid export membrane protein
MDVDYLGNNTHFRELVSSTSIIFVLRTLGLAAGYIFYFIVARIYGVEALGIWALTQTVLFVISVPAIFGLDGTNLRLIAQYAAQDKMGLIKEIYKKSIIIAIPVSIVFSILFFIFTPQLAKYIFHNTSLIPAFHISSFAICPLVLLVIHAESLRGLKRVVMCTLLRNISVLSIAVVIIIVFFISGCVSNLNDPVIAYTLAVGSVSFASIFLWLKISRYSKYQGSKNLSYRLILSVSFPLLLSGSTFLIMKWSDTLILGAFKTAVDVGIYNVCFKIAGLAQLPLLAVNSLAAPKFSELYATGDMQSFNTVIRQSTRLIFYISLPLLLPIIIFPGFFLKIFGNGFEIGKFPLLILIAGQFINAISGSVGIILNMTGKQKIFQNIIISAALINIVLNFILIPSYGTVGAAVASTVCMVYWNILSTVFIKKLYNVYTIYIPFMNNSRNDL